MLAGLIFQVVSLTLFAVCSAEFGYRVWKQQSNWNPRYSQLVHSRLFKCFLVGLFVATLTIFARSVYRCAELAGGFNGTLFTSDEALFMVLEGAMIVIATTCLTVFHPAVSFQGAWHEANFALRTRKNGSEKVEMTTSADEESQMSNLEPNSARPSNAY